MSAARTELSAKLARTIAAALSSPRCEFRPVGKAEDFGGGTARLVVRHGPERRFSSDLEEPTFVIQITEQPEGQRYE